MFAQSQSFDAKLRYLITGYFYVKSVINVGDFGSIRFVLFELNIYNFLVE
jgi:hypothetical protein